MSNPAPFDLNDDTVKVLVSEVASPYTLHSMITAMVDYDYFVNRGDFGQI